MNHSLKLEPNPDADHAVSSPSVNPLFLDLIIKNIFKYLHLDAIISCRAVCRYWQTFASELLKRRIDEICIKISSPASLKRFMAMESRSDLVFTNFKLIEPQFDNETYQMFFKEPRKEIKALELKCSELNQIAQNRFGDLLTRDLPSLKKLNLIQLPMRLIENWWNPNPRIPGWLGFSHKLGITSLIFAITPTTNYHHCRDFISNLRWATPEVQEFILNFSHNQNQRTYLTPHPALYEWANGQVMRDDLKAITELNFEDSCLCNPVCNLANLEEIFTVNKQVRSFKGTLSLVASNQNTFYLRSFFEPQSSSLEEVELRIVNRCVFEFPFSSVMPNLVSLSILSYDAQYATRGELNYGVQFPKLNTLKIRYSPVQSSTASYSEIHPGVNFFPRSAEPCPSVTSLELPEFLPEAATLRNIAQMFPNVRKLSIGNQKSEVLKVLWELWPRLEVLGLAIYEPVNSRNPSTGNLDSLFNGLSPEMVLNLRKHNSYTDDAADALNLKLEIEQDRLPSLKDLISLRYLVIHVGNSLPGTPCDVVSSWFKLSDLTGYLSFSKLKNLQCLLVDPRLHNLSMPCIEHICEELSLLNNSTYIGGFPVPSLVTLVKYDRMAQLNLASPSQGSEYPCTHWDEF